MSDMGNAPPGGLAVFVTSHGFGHLNRAVAVLNQIPPSIPITIFTDLALFGHWRERLQRPARLEARPADFGAYNPPGDSLTTDGPATIAHAIEAHRDALTRLDDDVAALRDGGYAAILCDAPSMPLVAARRAGIPGYLLANFTWADIYEEHAGPLGSEATRFVASLRDETAQATAIFRAEPALPLTGMAPLIEVGMVVMPGRDRGVELRERLGLASKHRLVYFYVGRYGQDGLGWERLARLESRGIHFVGFHPAPSPPANFHVVPAGAWTGADLAASCDVAVAKAGYGTVCEAIVAGTPLVYPPRTGFAEHAALERALEAWGGGVRVDPDDFRGLQLDAALDRALSLRPGPTPYPTDGARLVARHLAKLFGEDLD
jgi:UDP:flavonoid glycosyltransferase YjiC (YdhE family)